MFMCKTKLNLMVGKVCEVLYSSIIKLSLLQVCRPSPSHPILRSSHQSPTNHRLQTHLPKLNLLKCYDCQKSEQKNSENTEVARKQKIPAITPGIRCTALYQAKYSAVQLSVLYCTLYKVHISVIPKYPHSSGNNVF